MTSHPTPEDIRSALDARNLPLSTLAKNAGISRTSLQLFLTAGGTLSAVSRVRLCRCLLLPLPTDVPAYALSGWSKREFARRVSAKFSTTITERDVVNWSNGHAPKWAHQRRIWKGALEHAKEGRI